VKPFRRKVRNATDQPRRRGGRRSLVESRELRPLVGWACGLKTCGPASAEDETPGDRGGMRLQGEKPQARTRRALASPFLLLLALIGGVLLLPPASAGAATA
jgi:hypothetical protein